MQMLGSRVQFPLNLTLGNPIDKKLIAVLAATVVLVAIGMTNLRDRLALMPVASDGIQWSDTDNGLQAESISTDSPLARALRKGDYVRYILYGEKYVNIDHLKTLQLYLDKLGVDNDALYVIEHLDTKAENSSENGTAIEEVSFRIIAVRRDLGKMLYLALIGLIYLAMGLLVLLTQNSAALSYYFLAWFAASYVVFSYAPTLKFTAFDNFVDFLHKASLALVAPLFLHFCLRFPLQQWLVKRSRLLAIVLLYVPAGELVTVEALLHFSPDLFSFNSRLELRQWLDMIELSQCALFFVIGNLFLVRSLGQARGYLLRQQLKWIISGLGIGVAPFAVFHLVAHLASIQPSPLMERLAYWPLILAPLCVGYSIIRYRLTDVELSLRQGYIHITATVAVGAVYSAVLLALSKLAWATWITGDLSSGKIWIVAGAGMLMMALLLAPIKSRFQSLADRRSYGERYPLRRGIREFGKSLAQTMALPQLLDTIARRVSEMLSVDKVAIFLDDPRSPSGFCLANAWKLYGEISLPDNVSEIIRARSVGRGFISGRDLDRSKSGFASEPGIDLDEDLSDAMGPLYDWETELYYYVPCVVGERMIAIIGVGRARTGAPLTGEDIDLLRELSGYAAAAIHNSLVYEAEAEKARNLTRRAEALKQRAEEIARLKDLSESIIESITVGILVFDLNGRITACNREMERVLGIAGKGAIGRRVDEALGPGLVETIRRAIGLNSWTLRDARHIYKYNADVDGRRVTVNMSLAPFEAAREVVTGTLLLIEDVSDLTTIEQELKQQEKLSSLGLIAAGVGQEVNTPLAGISSYAEMLLQQIPFNDPRRKLVRKIYEHSTQASGVINDLLNVTGAGETQPHPVDLNQLLDESIRMLEPRLRGARVEVARNYTQGLPATMGQATRLQQVFINLILTARDSMPGGGRLTIQTRLVDTSVVVDFRDTGVGIALEEIARIHDPSLRTKKADHEMDLGLILCYGIIQEHGGRIFVESRPGEGTRFTVKLPAASERQTEIDHSKSEREGSFFRKYSPRLGSVSDIKKSALKK